MTYKCIPINICIYILFAIFIISIVGCSNNNTYNINRNIGNSAEQVTRDHFKWINEKNIPKINETLTDYRKFIHWELDNLEYIKIIDIHEEEDNSFKNSYMETQRGKKFSADNIIIFRVDYEVKYLDDKNSTQSSGKFTYWYFLIRKNAKSPWLIDDFGA